MPRTSSRRCCPQNSRPWRRTHNRSTRFVPGPNSGIDSVPRSMDNRSRRPVDFRYMASCACRKSNSQVQMMKSAEKWRRQNATNGMYCSRRRRVVVDRKVRASLVVVGRVRSQQMAEMPLAEHDNVVKTFPPDRTDRPFTISVLPRRSRRGCAIPNAHRPKAADEDVTVDGVAVTDDVSRRYFPTIGLGELVRNPFSRWVRSHSQPQDLAAIVLQYQQPVEQSE